MPKINKKYTNENGNVLFLILIAVALFAALSYAVTQSSRSGGSGSEREQGIVNAAGLTQYASSIRTAILRMTINNVGITQILFKNPGDDDYATQTATDGETRHVFHPDGGGASFQAAPANVLQAGADGEWHFRDGFFVPELGSDAESEIVAFLPGVSGAVCEELNSRYDIDTTLDPNIPNLQVTDAALDETISTGATTGGSGAATTYIAFAGGTAFPAVGAMPAILDGQPFGCFCDSGSACTGSENNVYYHVLVER